MCFFHIYKILHRIRVFRKFWSSQWLSPTFSLIFLSLVIHRFLSISFFFFKNLICFQCVEKGCIASYNLNMSVIRSSYCLKQNMLEEVYIYIVPAIYINTNWEQSVKVPGIKFILLRTRTQMIFYYVQLH